MKKIAIIGSGNMGSAIASSLCGTDYSVVCTAATEATLQKIRETIPGVETTLDNAAAVTDADIVVLAVKPYIADEVITGIWDHMKDGASVVSVIAGYDLQSLAYDFTGIHDPRFYGADYNPANDTEPEPKLNYFRVIPNTAIKYGKSVTFISTRYDEPEETIKEIVEIFKLSGEVFIVPERQMNVCTSLASCGIAYFLRFIRALTEGAVELGLKPSLATRIAALTAEGAGALLKDGAHPEAEIDKVTTPGGLTIKGLNALEANGFSNAAIQALKASTEKDTIF